MYAAPGRTLESVMSEARKKRLTAYASCAG
jgi:hypothetical protein